MSELTRYWHKPGKGFDVLDPMYYPEESGFVAWEDHETLIAQQAARIAEQAREISGLNALSDQWAEKNRRLAVALEQQRGGVVLPERAQLDRAMRLLSEAKSWITPKGNISISIFDRIGRFLEECKANPPGKFRIGDPVRKTKGSQWSGRIVGTYSTELTPEGYAVESFTEKGSVQIYPAAALEACEAPGECVAVPVCDTCHGQGEVWTGESQSFGYMSMQPPEPIMQACPECSGESVAQQGKAVGDE